MLIDDKVDRRAKGGFKLKGEARMWLDERLAEVRLGHLYRPEISYDELCGKFLAQYDVQPATFDRMEQMLKKSRAAFGRTPLVAIRTDDIAIWRKSMTPGTRWDATKAMRQVLERAVAWRYLVENPAKGVKNPQPHGKEVRPFDSWTEVLAVADELADTYRAIPILAAGTGLRPGEWIAVQAGDIDFDANALHVRRTFDSKARVVKEVKTRGPGRVVPLRQQVLDAVEHARDLPRRSLVFPAAEGGFIELHNWRNREWNPSVEAAGIEHRTPYALRHTFATWSLRAGVGTFHLSRCMGTSLEMIEKTYGHLTPDAIDYARGLLDEFDQMMSATADVRPSALVERNLAQGIEPAPSRALVIHRAVHDVHLLAINHKVGSEVEPSAHAILEGHLEHRSSVSREVAGASAWDDAAALGTVNPVRVEFETFDLPIGAHDGVDVARFHAAPEKLDPEVADRPIRVVRHVDGEVRLGAGRPCRLWGRRLRGGRRRHRGHRSRGGSNRYGRDASRKGTGIKPVQPCVVHLAVCLLERVGQRTSRLRRAVHTNGVATMPVRRHCDLANLDHDRLVGMQGEGHTTLD